MQHRTDVYLNGGTLTANDMYRPASGLRGITENYYRSLHVGEGTNSLNYTWKGGRRFGLLTSEVEGDGAPASVTLNIGNANEDTRTTFDRIVNFNGTIGGTAKNERNRIYIGAVDLADGYTMTISHNSHSKDLTKTGEGSLIITGTLSVENALTLQEGSLEVRGATTADDVTLTGGNLTAAALTADTYTLSGDATATHSGNVSTTASLSINTSGTVNLTNASSDGSVSIGGGTVTLSGNLTGLDSMSITGGATTAVNATAGDFSMSGGSLSLSGNMEVDSFRLTGGDLSLTGTGATGALTIHKELTMNYNGTLSYNSLRLDSGITLSYTAGAANLIQIPVSSGTYQNLEHISLNLLGLTGSQLYNNGNGINLGIAWAYKDTLDISTLSPSEYHLVNDNGYVVRKTYSAATTARTIWDRNWGNAVASAGPAEIKNVDWDIIGAKPGLYRSDYHTTSDKYDTCGIITGVPSTGYPAWADRAGSIIYGGAYGTARIDGSGGTVDRDVWLYAADGSITLLAGGSFEADANWNLGSASKEVDTHLLVSSGISTSGSFVAGNVRAVNTTSWTGDGYISVYSSNVTGSIVGGSVHTTLADEITATHTGNSTIYVYAPLSTNVNTRIWDTTRVDTANGLWDFIYGGLICGGSINSFASHTSEQTGDNFVTINLAGSGSSRSDMVKSIAGGHFGAGVQRQTGDTTVSILNTGGADFTGTAITAGHLAYVVDPDGDDASTPTATEQNQTGKGVLTLPNTGNSDFTRLIGGHASIGATANPNQGRTGNTTVSLTRVNGDVASITGGHYFTNNDDNDVTATQNQTGDMNITSSSLDVNGFLTGGHYNSATRNDFTNTNTATQNLTGSTNIRIDGGTYSGRVVAGHVFVDPDEDGRRGTYTGTITEGTHTTITGGTFGTVQGGSYIHANSNITNTSIGDVTMDLSGGTYDQIIGGYDIQTPAPCATSASIGDITLTLSGIRVNGTIYGGSVLTDHSPVVLQGNITLDLQSGTYLGDIYAAGRDKYFHDPSTEGGIQYDWNVGGPITESTTVKIHRNASFASGIIISGGYANGTSGHGGTTGSIVTNKTLAFVDAGTYSQSSSGITYTYFDAVDVAEGATVSLTQSLQAMAQSVTKMGAGTLKLGSTNNVDNVQVTAGTLALQGGSRSLTHIELLQVDEGATLDISAGNCGINGKLTMAVGSTLVVDRYQGASSLQELQWSTGGLVNIDIANAPETGAYTIELFTDRSTNGGLTMESISGIEFDEVDGQYIATASDYLTSDMSLANAYLVLREDGTLVLTNVALRSLYWSGDDGDVWNVRNAIEWAPHDDEVASTDYLDGSNVYFTKDGTVADPMTVVVGEDVSPSAMTFIEGNYEFTTDTDATISTSSLITLTEATVDMGSLLDTSAKVPSLTLVDEDSSFKADNDIHLNKLNSNGSVTIGGNLTLDRGTDNGGTLAVGKDLKLGGSSAFDELTVDGAVTGNKGYTLTTGTDSRDASLITSIDGGSVVVRNGKLDITTTAGTSLTSLGGTGSLKTGGSLTLAQASRIGNLTAPSLTLSDRLDATKTLTTSAIMLKELQLSPDTAMVEAGKIATGTEDSPVAVKVSESTVSRQVLSDGVTYYIVRGESVADGTSFTINGEQEQIIKSHRYDYHLKAEENGVSITGIATNYSFYEENATTENGRTGGQMMDTLFQDSSVIAANPNGDLRRVIDALDDMLVRTSQPQAADTLNAAVAGSTVPTLISAFSGDMERQLKSIRNRTTTMGLGSECLAYENLPYFNAWVNAEGNHHELDSDNTYTGYKLDSWGGTVGFDVDISNSFTCGFAITALMGDFSADGANSLDGDLDTQYITLFARYYKRAWVHTFVASVGRVDVSYDRTVAIPGYGSYITTGDTDGTGFGFMYEIGYVMAMNEEGTTCLQPVANITVAHTSISGYTESGSDAALTADDMDMTTLTIGAGARMQASFGENIYNRTSIFEARALVKFLAGDRRGEADMAFAATEQAKGTVKSTELGSVRRRTGRGHHRSSRGGIRSILRGCFR